MSQVVLPHTIDTGTEIAAAEHQANYVALRDKFNGNIDADNLTAAEAQKLGLTAGSTVRRGKSIVVAEESRTNAAYGLLATADRVSGIVLPSDGLIVVAYQAQWKESVANTASAELFLGVNGIKSGFAGLAAPSLIPASINSANNYVVLSTHSYGIASLNGASLTGAYTGDVATGQVVGGARPNPTVSSVFFAGGPVHLFAAAGTYDVSIQFKASSGTVTVKERKLWVWTIAF